jgi:hypothetical protein
LSGELVECHATLVLLAVITAVAGVGLTARMREAKRR